MRTVPLSDDVAIETVWFDERTLFVGLSDGRTVGTPIRWYPRLERASAPQRQNWRLIAQGEGIHWPDVAGRAAPGAQI